MAKLTDKIAQMRAQWDRLSARERQMLAGLGGVAALMLTLLCGYFVWSGLSEIDEHNTQARQLLKDIAQHREEFLEARVRAQSQEVRISRTPVALGTLLDAAAIEAGVKLDEQNDRTPVPRGKKYLEKGVDVKIRRVDLQSLTRLLKKLETGPNLVVVDRLLLRARYNEHDQLDVEMGVTTFERAPEGPRKPGGAPEKADKT
jgi:type II secretory pathway component PulM